MTVCFIAGYMNSSAVEQQVSKVVEEKTITVTHVKVSPELSSGTKPNYNAELFTELSKPSVKVKEAKEELGGSLFAKQPKGITQLELAGVYGEGEQVSVLIEPTKEVADSIMGISKERDVPYRPAVVGDAPLNEAMNKAYEDNKKGIYTEVDIPKDEDLYKERPAFSDMNLLGGFLITAYDLSFQSTEKRKGDKGYGITKGGMNLTGLTRDQARAVAVDPKVIPLGSKLYLEFTGEYASYSGVYRAVDVGGAIKGNHIDLFMGDFDNELPDKSVYKFGRQGAIVYQIL